MPSKSQGLACLSAGLALICAPLLADVAHGAEPAGSSIPVAGDARQLDAIMREHAARGRVQVVNLITGRDTARGSVTDVSESGLILQLQTPELPAGRHRLWVPMKLVPFGDGRLHDLGVSIRVGDRKRKLIVSDFSARERFRNFCIDFTARASERMPVVVEWGVGRFAMDERYKAMADSAPQTVAPDVSALVADGPGADVAALALEDPEAGKDEALLGLRTISAAEAAEIEVRLELLPPVVEAHAVAAGPLKVDALPYAPGEGLFRLAGNGEAAAGIVVSRDVRASVEPFTRSAPDVLTAELSFLTGARFGGAMRGDAPTIEIGETSAARAEGITDLVASLGRDGFCIRVTPRRIFLCGATPSGTACAVYAFLNDVLRVRKYHPDTLFHAAPYAPDAALPTGEMTQTPDFRLRAFSSGGFYSEDCPRSDVWWQAYNGLQYHTDSFAQPYAFHHAMAGIFQDYNRKVIRDRTQQLLKAETLDAGELGLDESGGDDDLTDGLVLDLVADAEEEEKKERPKTPEDRLFEVLDHLLPDRLPPEKRGQAISRLVARKAGWQPCFSHPETARICAEAAVSRFAEDPELAAFSLGMNDGGGCCFGEACREMLEDEYLVVSDSYKYWNQGSVFYAFVNDVAKRVAEACPGKMLGALCYHYTTAPPLQYTLRDNVFLLRNFYLANTSPEWVEKVLEPWDGKCAHLGVYEYAYPTTAPRFNLHNLQPVLRQRRQKGGNFFYAEVYPDWQIEGPKYWLMTRLLWDNEADVKQGMAEYCRDLFGAASEIMLEYWDLCARIAPDAQERGAQLSPWGGPLSQAQAVHPYVERMQQLLADAEDAAESLISKERIRYFREPVDVDLDLLARIGKTYAAATAPAASPQALLDNAVAGIVRLGELEQELGAITHRSPVAKRDMPAAQYAGGIGAVVTSRLGSMLAESLRQRGAADRRALSQAAQEVVQTADARFAQEPEKSAFDLLEERLNHVFKGSMSAVPAVDRPIVADGLAEEAFLRQALKIRLGPAQGTPSDGGEQEWTEVYLGYDHEALYVTARSLEADPSVFEGHSRDGNYNLFTGDAMTFLFAPLSGAELALRITIDVRGKVYAWIPPERFAQAYDADARIWTVELALPWDCAYMAEHKMRPGSFELLRANFLRHYKAPPDANFRGHGPLTRATSWYAPAAAAPAGRSPGDTGLLVLE